MSTSKRRLVLSGNFCCGFNLSDQCDLCYRNPAATKPAFAIHQIIAPQTTEDLIKFRRQPAGFQSIFEPDAPPPQCFGIMKREMDRRLPTKPALLGQCPEGALGQEHSPRKNVCLDEVCTC